MAIRARSLLRKWFGRGQYPTAEQFSDFFDSFVHRDEDKIALDKVDELPDRLNGKYGQDDGVRLERQVEQLSDTLSGHIVISDDHFTRLDEGLAAETARAEGEEAAIREELTAGDAATLQAGKTYTDGKVADEATLREQGDAATLQAAKTYTDTETARAKGEEATIRNELTAGDAATLQYTDGKVADEATLREHGDASTLQSAKTYTDTETARAEGEEAAIRGELTAGDAATLQAGKTYADGKVAAEAALREQGDAATLQSANEHTGSLVASEQAARESGDRTTLQSAKDYVDTAIAELVDGSPAALDTLKELSTALGDDPNFAATVAGQIGQKVDKVTGKGLSTEDYTTADKTKLAGIAAGANNYVHPTAHPASIITQDTSHRFVTDTEKSTWNGKASTAVATASANGLMAAADKKKLDGIAAGANNYVHPTAHPASMIAEDTSHRFITDAEREAWNSKATGVVATPSANGLMSAADKTKLDGIAAGANNYVHPTAHPASIITQDASHRFVTDTEKSTWNGKASTAVATASVNGLMAAADKKKLDGLQKTLTIQLNGESQPAYDGSVARTINITPESIGAQTAEGYPQYGLQSSMIGWNIGRTATLFIPGYGTKSLPSGGLSMNIGINIGYPVYIFELSSNISTTVSNLVIECSHSTTPGSGTKVFDYKQNINYCGAVMFTKKTSGVVLQIAGFMFYPTPGNAYVISVE
jgi:hypothetical protein